MDESSFSVSAAFVLSSVSFIGLGLEDFGSVFVCFAMHTNLFSLWDLGSCFLYILLQYVVVSSW